MSDCRKCAKAETCAVDEDCGLYVEKQLTNADRIRAMTDEELAEMLNHAQGDGYLVGIGQRRISAYGNWLEWLKEECEP